MTFNEPVVRVPESTPSGYGEINVNKLGRGLDAWADVVEGMGGKVTEVQQAVAEKLSKRMLRNAYINPVIGVVSALSGERRPFLIGSISPGATTTIYIAQQGEDLFVCWRSFLNQVINANVVGGVILFGLALGTLIALNMKFIGFWGWLIVTLAAILIAVNLVQRAGVLIKGNPYAFFFQEATVFTTDDITAMNITIHKTLIGALDEKGIDISKLRLKQDFRTGRRDEMV